MGGVESRCRSEEGGEGGRAEEGDEEKRESGEKERARFLKRKKKGPSSDIDTRSTARDTLGEQTATAPLLPTSIYSPHHSPEMPPKGSRKEPSTAPALKFTSFGVSELTPPTTRRVHSSLTSLCCYR